MESQYHIELKYAIAAAQSAGDLLRDSFRSGYNETTDRLAEERIHHVLTTSFPSYGYRGEELGLLSRPRDEKQHSWLVDPHDGTGAAVAGFRGAAVSIALLRDGAPILGVVYAYAAPDDAGDLFCWAEGSGPVSRNGVVVARKWPEQPTSDNTVLVSHDADRNPRANADLVRPMRYRAVAGLAYRLALVAAGEGDLAVSLNSPVGWDFAAGQALLRGSDGDLFDEYGSTVKYDLTGLAHCGARCFGGSRSLVQPVFGRKWRQALSASWDRAGAAALCRPVPAKTVDNSGLLARAQGCLLGQMAGDALGSLVEFRDSLSINRQYLDGPRLMADGGTWGTIAGQPTDDSELALSLARCIVDQGLYSREQAALSYARWYDSKPFDIGMATTKALSAAARHLHSSQPGVASAATAAASAETQANGALMRCSPLGIFGTALSLEDIARFAREDAAITHPNVICQDANAVFAIALSIAIRRGCKGLETVYQTLDAADHLHVCQPVRECLQKALSSPPHDYLTHSGWVLVALQNAFYQMHRATSFEQGIVDTVRSGGDTDTNAAIAGALLGAIWGRNGIPAQWADRILTCRAIQGFPGVEQPRPAFYWPVDTLCLAEKLVLAGMSVAKKNSLPIPEPVRAEYVGDYATLVSMKFEEARGLALLASAGKTSLASCFGDDGVIQHHAGLRGLVQLELEINRIWNGYRDRVRRGELIGSRFKDIPGFPDDPWDGERSYPLGERLYLVCSMDEGCALMQFAMSSADLGPESLGNDAADVYTRALNIFHYAEGKKAILRVYDAGIETMRRHRQQTGFPGWLWGATEHPLNLLLEDEGAGNRSQSTHSQDNDGVGEV